MIVKVRKEKNEYYSSLVFASVFKGIDFKVIVFNSSYDRLIEIDWWEKSKKYIKSNAFHIGGDREGWEKNGKYSGLPFIVKNKEALDAIKHNKPIENQILEKALFLQNSIKKEEWNSVKSDRDVKELLDCTSGFHDAYLKSIKYDNNILQLNFDITCWGYYVIMEAHDIKENTLSEKHIDSVCILDASVKIENSFIKWQVDFTSYNNIDMDEREDMLFVAKDLKWKIIIADEK